MRGVLLALFVCVLPGCSLLVQFDPQTQPCDPAGACLSGYQCVDGLCLSTDAGGVDAGEQDSGSCPAKETNCADGVDDDCDQLTDCADPDCEAQGCDDLNPCTTGNTCAGGSCNRGTPVVCDMPPSPCMAQAGTCEAGTGRCLYASLADGVQCGTAAAARCCGGTCINTTLNTANCGGCGLSCGMGQVCQPINQSTCSIEPIDTSGRCSCNATTPCPRGQACTNGFCVPASATQCSPGQSVTTAGVSCTRYCRY